MTCVSSTAITGSAQCIRDGNETSPAHINRNLVKWLVGYLEGTVNDPTEIRYLAKSTSVEYPAHGSHYTALLEIEPQDNGRPPFSAQLIDQPMDEGIDYLRFAQELKNNPKYYKKRFLNGDFERQ